MAMWRYTAVQMDSSDSPGSTIRTTGEMAGETAAEVRAALRRIKLQVIDLKRRPDPRPRKTDARNSSSTGDVTHELGGILAHTHQSLDRYLCRRRQPLRSELYDGLATMLQSGLPLLEAVETVLVSARRQKNSFAAMLTTLREQLQSGLSLSEAMRDHPAWFDGTEVAMVNAGQHAGNLALVLRSLSDRFERSDQLSQKLIGALTYPFVILLVGLGVVAFLSTKTLPDLTEILQNADIPIPTLTEYVMAFGRFLTGHWLLLGLFLLGFIFAAAILPRMLIDFLGRQGGTVPRWWGSLRPRVFRRMAVAAMVTRLAELIASGVPIVEALRVLAPTCRITALRLLLRHGADCVERGEELSVALDDDLWFDAEFRRLLDIGQAGGDLDVLLARVGRRYERQSSRLIERFAALLEPAVILALAFLVGIVVMAAILPLIRLQEII